MKEPNTSLSIRNYAPTRADTGAIEIPEMLEIKQRFPKERVSDVRQTVLDELAPFSTLDWKGKHIAVTAGSRGIHGMVETLQAIVSQLASWGANPFLVPAMGSHGGATAEGQVAVLENLGITEATIGAPIRASMEVVELGRIQGDTPVCCDRLAFESDGIIVCNRIKAHTAFVGDHESGLLKMMAIGLGKHVGTTGLHRLGFGAFAKVIPEAAAVILEKAPILFGVGLVENAYNQVARIEALPPKSLFDREKELLRFAKTIMGRLLISEIDILVVDELGKDVSGAGLDSNVTGRAASGLRRPEAPTIGRIIVRDLSKKTAGNALGMGLADFMCKRAADKVVLSSTYTNAITAGALLGAKMPIVATSDRDALSLAFQSSTGCSNTEKRIVHIRNTKTLDTIWLSSVFLPEILEREDIVVVGKPRSYEFDNAGSMTWPTER